MPGRPGLVASGTLSDPVPVAGLTPNFSPMPRIAPPPLGKETLGSGVALLASVVEVSLEVEPLGSPRPSPAAGPGDGSTAVEVSADLPFAMVRPLSRWLEPTA